MNALSKLLKIKVAETSVTDGAPAAPVPADEAALAAATARLAKARSELEKLRVTREDLRERGESLTDERTALLRKLASGDDVAARLGEVEAGLARAHSMAEGTNLLISSCEVEEHAASEAYLAASEPVERRRKEQALAQATAAADAAAARFYDLFGQTSVAIADLEDALDHLGSVGGDPANYGRALTAYGRDPLTKLMQSGWKLRDTRTVYIPRVWTISALVPPPERVISALVPPPERVISALVPPPERPPAE